MEKKIDEFKGVAEWIQEELAGMVDAYKEKNIKTLAEEAHDYEFIHDDLLSLTSENEEKISRACKNVHFADTYFELMETEFGRFLVSFERIVKDEDFEIRYIEED